MYLRVMRSRHRDKRISFPSFIRNVFVVVSGLGGGHAIALLLMPVLSRRYSPDDFGVWSVMKTSIAYLTMVSTLRYEMAIPLEKDRQVLRSVVWVPLTNASIFSMLLLSVWIIERDNLSYLFGINQMYWLSIPLGVLFSAWAQIFSYVLIRNERFKPIAVYNITQKILQMGIPLLMAVLYKARAWGLLAGDIFSRFWGLLFLTWMLAAFLEHFLGHFPDIRHLLLVIKKYKNFPIYTLPAAMLHNLLFVTPIYFMSLVYGKKEVGFFSLTQSVLLGPLLLLSQGVAQVFFGRASTLYREQREQIYTLFWRTFGILLGIGLLPGLILIAWGPNLFSVVFGARWVTSGIYARLLVVGVLAQFCVGPVYQVLNIIGQQKFITISAMISVGIFILISLFVYFMHWSAKMFVGLYSVIVLMEYSLLLIFTNSSLKNSAYGR